uniref:Uncharacterized protein n=1 Tax=Bos indicus x Bos taurus TaxID=30522 RepID=A0A4W2E4D5_BOBOX
EMEGREEEETGREKEKQGWPPLQRAGWQLLVGHVHRSLKSGPSSRGLVGLSATGRSAADLEDLTTEESDSVVKAAIAGGEVTPRPHIPAWEERTTGD